MKLREDLILVILAIIRSRAFCLLICCLKCENRIYRTIIFPVLYGCETLSLTLREEHRLRVFENRVLRRIFGPKRGEVTVNGENCIMRSFVIYTLRQV
jgi:hypothetical protein